jgi:hypothetical protein
LYGSKLFFENVFRMGKLAERPKITYIQKQFEGVTDLPDGRVTSSPLETKIFRGLDDDFGLKRPNHHLGPEYVHLFRAKKV